jgi:hypothetical protein
MNVRVHKPGGSHARDRSTKHAEKLWMRPSRKASRRRLKGTALQEMLHLRRTKNLKIYSHRYGPDVVFVSVWIVMSNEWRRKRNQVLCCGFFGHSNLANNVVTGNDGVSDSVDYWVARAL